MKKDVEQQWQVLEVHFRHLTVYRPLSGGLSAARLVRQHG